MADYSKIYIFTTGKQLDKIVFRQLAIPTQIQHPTPVKPITDINEFTVKLLIDLTAYDTVDNILVDSTFQNCLKNDWIKAYNEFAIEIDNYTSKLAPDNNFVDGDTVVWDEATQQFKSVAIATAGYTSTDFNSDFDSKQLTITPDNTPVATGDTTQTAIGKLQGQISNLPTGAKITRLVVLQTIPANTSVGVASANSYFSFEGDVPNLLASANAFNSDMKIQVYRNGTPQDKGTEVSRQSSTNISFNEILDVTEAIFIYSY